MNGRQESKGFLPVFFVGENRKTGRRAEILPEENKRKLHRKMHEYTQCLSLFVEIYIFLGRNDKKMYGKIKNTIKLHKKRWKPKGIHAILFTDAVCLHGDKDAQHL